MLLALKKQPDLILAFLIFAIVFLFFSSTHGKKIDSDNHSISQSCDVSEISEKIDFSKIKKSYRIDDKVVTTNINFGLQMAVEKEFDKRGRLTRGKPVDVIIRAIDPANGNVILAANFSKDKPLNFTTLYPAASIFKIVSAAGVVDKYGFDANKVLFYNGASHTLYRSQLRDRKNRYTNRTTLKNAFAKSVNPVFGKIGKKLGIKNLNYYSEIFGFDDDIKTDVPLILGKTKRIKNSYNIAETASGFNRETIISPIFGSIISSSIINNGKVFKPHFIKSIKDRDGKTLYRVKPELHKEILRGRTLKVLRELMVRTVKNGTARKAFRRARYDRFMRGLVIGGKTGSISNHKHSIRYDWFTGFARSKKDDRAIALSVLVMHGKYLGKRSGDYAYMIIKNYFKTQKA